MPVTVTGDEANGAIAARVMNVSGMSAMSTVRPASAPPLGGPAPGPSARGAVGHPAAHGLEDVEEADVALQAAAAPQAGDRHPARRERRGGEEVRGRGSVGLDGVVCAR